MEADCWSTSKAGRHDGGDCHRCGADLTPRTAGMEPRPA
jgi:hypothetical protein